MGNDSLIGDRRLDVDPEDQVSGAAARVIDEDAPFDMARFRDSGMRELVRARASRILSDIRSVDANTVVDASTSHSFIAKVIEARAILKIAMEGESAIDWGNMDTDIMAILHCELERLVRSKL